MLPPPKYQIVTKTYAGHHKILVLNEVGLCISWNSRTVLFTSVTSKFYPSTTQPYILIRRRNGNRKFSQRCSKLVHNITYVRFLVTCDYSEKNSMIKFHMEWPKIFPQKQCILPMNETIRNDTNRRIFQAMFKDKCVPFQIYS